MTLYELAMVSPQCFIFIREDDGRMEDSGTTHEYLFPGGIEERQRKVIALIAKQYPMHKHVLEVRLED